MATLPTPTITPALLAEIATIQATRPLDAYGRGFADRHLASLQHLYARRRTQLDLLNSIFDEGVPELTLRGETQQLTLRGELVGNTCATLREAFSNVLNQLELAIVHAHQDAADYQAEVAEVAASQPDYVPLMLALCEPSAPVLPGLMGSEWERRTDAAEARENALQQEYGNEHAYGREILWHLLFPAEYVALVSEMPLAEVASYHTLRLAEWCNQGRALDGHDYQYLTDVLREALASQPTELAALRLRRALAWVEQATALLRPTSWPTATPDRPTLATAA